VYQPPSHITFGKKQIPIYGICVITGYVLGAGLFLFLVQKNDLSVLKGSLSVLLSIIASWLLGLGMKKISGVENFVFLHFAILIMLCSSLVVFLFDETVLAYLDFLSLAILLGLAIGRVGCLHGGCCHGCRMGTRNENLGNYIFQKEAPLQSIPFAIVYPKPHDEADQPLFPIQGVETLGAGMMLFLLLSLKLPEGYTLAWATLGYAYLRSTLEVFRGDLGRPYWRGMSEAQWTLLGLNVFLFIMIENSTYWQGFFILFLILFCGWFIWVNSALGATYRWFHINHIQELKQRASSDFMSMVYGEQPEKNWLSKEGAKVKVWREGTGEWKVDVQKNISKP
jgi:prolipoprotein diacylglyceryltransferase